MAVSRGPSRWTCASAVAAMMVAVLQLSGVGPAAADTAPVDPAEPETVSADALPTVQTNGVVWAQVIVGNRVYATGDFRVARPSGAAAGTSETARRYILAYDLASGALVTSWAPTLNAQGNAIAASEDGSVIYVGGDFTQVNGTSRGRVAAINAQTGALLPFTASVNGRVEALAVSGNTLYVGGRFSVVSSQARSRLAALNATSGAVTSWAPSADDEVVSMTVHKPSGRVIVGGNFQTVNGADQRGMTSIDGATGVLRPWAVNTIIRNYGLNSYISGLTTDGETVYGSGWNFGGGEGVGNFEGAFAADPLTGALEWVNGCRGDSYGITVSGEVVYTVNHAHDCGMVGGHPQTEPWTFQRAQAFDKRGSLSGNTNARGTPDTWKYFPGRPATDILHWLPSVSIGTYTGQNQGAWSIASNDDYVVLGGEFPRVNGRNQYGLVRFAKRSIAPNRDAIQGAAELAAQLTALGPGTVRVGWTAAWDRDNERLTVEVLRGSTVIGTFQTDSNWWTRPPLGFIDSGAPPGTTQSYRVRVRDPFGNSLTGATASIAVPGGTPPSSTYRTAIGADDPVHHWRLGEASGTTARDWSGSDDLTLGTSAQRNVPGALQNESDPATTFPGTSNTGTVQGASAYWAAGPQTFSIEAWVRTSSTQGGKIVGFGNSATGRSSTDGVDRHLYMTNNGAIRFGVRPDMGERRTITSGSGLNDNRWHHVVGSLSSAGMRLYVDGSLVAQDATVTKAQVYRGFWRIGGDRLSSWPSLPAREAIAASIDEVAVYDRALSADQVRAHYQASGRGVVDPNDPPVASFSAAVDGLSVSVDGSGSSDPDGSVASYAWDFGDGATGSGAAASHTYAGAGSHTVRLTVTDDAGATAGTTRVVSVTDGVPHPEFARDRFERSVTGGLGSAEVGGAWTTTSTGTFGVSGGAGRITGAVSSDRAAFLPSVSQVDQDITLDLSLDRAVTSGSAYVSVIGRRVSAGNDYRVKVRYTPTGLIAYLVRTVSGTETTVSSATVAGVTPEANERIRVRFQVTGTSSTTARAKVWLAGAAEPAGWTVANTAAAPAALQQPGHLGVLVYLASSFGAPATLAIDNLAAIP